MTTGQPYDDPEQAARFQQEELAAELLQLAAEDEDTDE